MATPRGSRPIRRGAVDPGAAARPEVPVTVVRLGAGRFPWDPDDPLVFHRLNSFKDLPPPERMPLLTRLLTADAALAPPRARAGVAWGGWTRPARWCA